MKKILFLVFFALFFSWFISSQEIPKGIEMGMTLTQIKHLMTNGTWQEPEQGYQVFFSTYPLGIYAFRIVPAKGLVALEIILRNITLRDATIKLTQYYGVPYYSSGNYIWGIYELEKGEVLPNNLFNIVEMNSTEYSDCISIRYIFNNAEVSYNDIR